MAVYLYHYKNVIGKYYYNAIQRYNPKAVNTRPVHNSQGQSKAQQDNHQDIKGGAPFGKPAIDRPQHNTAVHKGQL